MRSLKRLLWLLALLLVAALAISTSVQGTSEESVEKSPQSPPPQPTPQSEELDEDIFEGYDYNAPDESEIDSPKQSEYSQQGYPQQQPLYPQPQSSVYVQQPLLVAYPQPQYYPAVPYQPVPVPNYTVPVEQPIYFEQPAVPIEIGYSSQEYSQPQVAYRQPSPQVVYQPPPPPPVYNYTPPVVSYQPAPVVNYTAPVYVEKPVEYSAPPVYQQAPVYVEKPIVVNYQPPPPPPVVSYQPAPVANYTPQVYVEKPIEYAPPPVYQQAPVYVEKPVAPVYQQAPPVYVEKPVVNYQPLPLPQPVYEKPIVTPAAYQPPVYNVERPVVVNYTVPIKQTSYVQQQPIVKYNAPKFQQYNAPALVQKYSLAELAPFISPFGYRSNHWTQFFYRAAPYRQCPKQLYLRGPNYRDIEGAFVHALSQLGQFSNQQQNYMNSSQHTFAARHQIFSYLSQAAGTARMDEEGLLVEFVSQYLADRLCLTKWDKQRYLPQLTKLISASNFPGGHACSNYYQSAQQWQGASKQCYSQRYRTFDGFCNNPHHPYWGKANVCHIRLLSPDYADGISLPRNSYNQRYPLPNPRAISNYIHNDVPLDGPYNLMKMQWGQFINHDITNTALSSYDGLVDCCKNPQTRGCWPIYVPPGDRFYSPLNVTCLNFIRSGVCPTCQLGPRQQTNKNTAFMDLSHVYGQSLEQANQLRAFRGGLLRTSGGKGNEILLPIASSQEQCSGTCFQAGDSRVNQHPALTALHTLLLRNHNRHAQALAQRHPHYSDEQLFQEARRINIAEYQMITYNEYLPIVFGPILSAYYKLTPQRSGYTWWSQHADPTTWNEYSTASCRFGHSQIQSVFGLYSRIAPYGQQHDAGQPSFRLKDWFLRSSLLNDGMMVPIVNGLLGRPSQTVDPWLTNDVRNHLYQSHKEHSGGDLAATNIWRGRDHGLPGYVHYVEYCFNHKVRGWKDLSLFIPYYTLNKLRKLYIVVENIDFFTGGMAERHFPGADIGPTFACVNGIQYHHLKFGDRYYFEHGNSAGAFNPIQLEEIRRTTLARLLCRTAYLPAVPQYAFLQPSHYNPLVNCSQLGDIDYNKF